MILACDGHDGARVRNMRTGFSELVISTLKNIFIIKHCPS